jgi:pyruvate formate lyase activating enzyme
MTSTPDSEIYDLLPLNHICTDRRTFLQLGGACLCIAAAHCLDLAPQALAADDSESRFRREAGFYQKLPNRMVRCKLCPRQCTVPDGERGYCRVRENRGGTYYTLVHSRVVAEHIDPIEKKPFFHFLPGAMAFSVASGGCNVNCKFCQNWEISQARPEQLRAAYLPPKELASSAARAGCPVMAYTYSEPVVWTEYVLDACEAGHHESVRSVMVSNGYIQQEPLRRLCGNLDAIKIDLKAFSDSYYSDVVRGEFKPVLNSIVAARKQARWLEIVYLVVPTLNDSDAEFRNLARWMKSEIGPDVPIHFTRFTPLYLLRNLPPTPVQTLERAKSIADAEGLHYAYIGNIPGHPGENTHCPKCRQLLIERAGFSITQMSVKKGRCNKCGNSIPGVWA